MTDKIVEALVAKHRRRARTGAKKYGVTMDRGDLTQEQWLTHLQEELMDAAIYIEKLLRQREAR